MRMYDIIEKKRDGYVLTAEEINFFINGFSTGNIPDYQASALLMAIYLRGMTEDEIFNLTGAMIHSGEIFNLSSIPGIKFDKHSTGGVGDKTTLIVAPVAAACGVPIVKLSGKGLGHTGGTIDKLNSIPGFNSNLTIDQIISNVRKIGLSISTQTGNITPADKKVYALRDVTATSDCIPLIASSIMSKKIATGSDVIVLDVKTGSGALTKSIDDSIKLAKLMVGIGRKFSKKTVAFITEMDNPLGYSIGNSLEIIEAIETLKGRGPKDLLDISIVISSKILELAGKGNPEHCTDLAVNSIKNGTALNKFAELISIQGGNRDVIYDYSLFGESKLQHEVTSDATGYISSYNTKLIGIAAMILGAGRETEDSLIDNNAGIILKAKVGDFVTKGDTLATFYSDSENKLIESNSIFKKSILYSSEKPVIKPLIHSFID
ncbi:MAG: thymidine phosphorylase [Clostridia bacterium]